MRFAHWNCELMNSALALRKLGFAGIKKRFAGR